MSKKAALLIGCCTDGSSGFPELSAPARDVEKLKEVLTDPLIGDFAAKAVLNEPSGTIREKIERSLADAGRDDLLLLYFSSHGVLDSSGRLHFVAVDTHRNLLGATGIEAQWVKERMQQANRGASCSCSTAATAGRSPEASRVAPVRGDRRAARRQRSRRHRRVGQHGTRP